MYAAWLAELLPPVVGMMGHRVTTPARRWMVVWCLLVFGNGAISLVLAMRAINNLWVGYAFMPLTGAVALWALSCWHRPGTIRLTLRAAIPFFVAVSAVLTLRLEDPRAFSLVAAPFHGLVLLIAAIGTFIRLSMRETEPLAACGWFWTIGGFMLYAGTTTAIEPASWYLQGIDRLDLVVLMFNVKAGSDLLAFAAMTRGLLCPVPPTSSGGSSSPASSPWESW